MRFFEKFLKFYRNLRENLGENLENFGNMHLWGLGGGAPECSKIIKNLVKKSMETCKLVEIFMNYQRIFT